MANGCRVTTASRKTRVSPAITILRAISLGVFWRCAPSTRAIMRSRKVSPGLDVMRTLIQSLSTLVPPVTALRSPPDSRMTGALSPVMADSSTLAMPSMTSPSPGMVSPASTRMISPERNRAEATISVRSPCKRRALVSVLVLRRVSACALPRPSAMASAKLANSTVNHSHREIWKVKPATPAPAARSRTVRRVVRTAPTSTTNMTGFFIMWRGLSFTSASVMARLTMGGSRIGRERDPLRGTIDATSSDGDTVSNGILAPQPPLMHQEMFHDRAQRESREKRQRAHDHHYPHEQHDEHRTVGGEGAGRDGHQFLLRQAAGGGEQRNQHQEAPAEHGESNRRIEVHGVGVDSGERAAVVAYAAGVGVQHLAQSVRAIIAQAALHGGLVDAHGRKAEDADREHEHGEHDHLDFLLLDLLPQIFRGAAHHQSGDENREDGEQEHAVQARSDAAEDNFAQLDVDHRHEAAQRGEAIVHVVDGAAACVRGDDGEERRGGDTEAHLLAFHVAARPAQAGQHRIAGLFRRGVAGGNM